MKAKDVKNILDIPFINAETLKSKLKLSYYVVEDSCSIYSLKKDNSSFSIEVISDETLIAGKITLEKLIRDLTNFDEIYFSMSRVISGEIIESYHFRPLIDENKKEY